MSDASVRLHMLRGTPGLSPAEVEALALLAEECAEVIAVIGKALRHGLDSTHPSGGPSNRDAISEEMGQVIAAMSIAEKIGALNIVEISNGTADKWRRVGQYLHHLDVDPVTRTVRLKP